MSHFALFLAALLVSSAGATRLKEAEVEVKVAAEAEAMLDEMDRIDRQLDSLPNSYDDERRPPLPSLPSDAGDKKYYGLNIVDLRDLFGRSNQKEKARKKLNDHLHRHETVGPSASKKFQDFVAVVAKLLKEGNQGHSKDRLNAVLNEHASKPIKDRIKNLAYDLEQFHLDHEVPEEHHDRKHSRVAERRQDVFAKSEAEAERRQDVFAEAEAEAERRQDVFAEAEESLEAEAEAERRQDVFAEAEESSEAEAEAERRQDVFAEAEESLEAEAEAERRQDVFEQLEDLLEAEAEAEAERRQDVFAEPGGHSVAEAEAEAEAERRQDTIVAAEPEDSSAEAEAERRRDVHLTSDAAPAESETMGKRQDEGLSERNITHLRNHLLCFVIVLLVAIFMFLFGMATLLFLRRCRKCRLFGRAGTPYHKLKQCDGSPCAFTCHQE